MTYPRRRTAEWAPLRGRAIFALVRRDFMVNRSYRLALGFDLFIGVLELVVYYFISKTFKGATSAPLGAAPTYFAFALVGIAVTVVINATSTGLGTRVREEQLTGTLEALVTQPIRTTEMALGLCGMSFLFAVARVAFYLVAAGTALGLDLSHASLVGFAVVLLATGAAMLSIGILTAATVLVVKRGYSLASLAIFGMGLVGGAFFPVSVLPGWLQVIGHVVPTRFAFDGLRSALYTGGGWGIDALVLTGFALVLLPVALWFFQRALRWATRNGSLSQY